MPDEQNAAPSPADQKQETPPVQTEVEPTESEDVKDLASYSQEEYDNWLKTGEQAKPKGKDAEPTKEVKPEGTPPKDAAASDAAKDSKEIKDKKPSGAEKRIDQLAQTIQDQLKQRKELRTEIETLQKQMESLRKGEVAPAAPAAAQQSADLQAPVKPNREDYETWEQYDDAKDKWRDEMTAYQMQRRDQERAQEDARKQSETTKKQQEDSWDRRTAEAMAVYDDYEDVTSKAFSPEVPINPQTDRHMLFSDNGAKILYYLSKNPEEAKRIAALNPAQTNLEMAALESKFAGSKSPDIKTITSALPPPKDFSGRNGSPSDEVVAALEAGDPGRYIAAMNARESNRR